MAVKTKVNRVLVGLVWPFGWCFGFAVATCFRRTEQKLRPLQHKRAAGWRQTIEPTEPSA